MRQEGIRGRMANNLCQNSQEEAGRRNLVLQDEHTVIKQKRLKRNRHAMILN